MKGLPSKDMIVRASTGALDSDGLWKSMLDHFRFTVKSIGDNLFLPSQGDLCVTPGISKSSLGNRFPSYEFSRGIFIGERYGAGDCPGTACAIVWGVKCTSHWGIWRVVIRGLDAGSRPCVEEIETLLSTDDSIVFIRHLSVLVPGPTAYGCLDALNLQLLDFISKRKQAIECASETANGYGFLHTVVTARVP